jgi:hypothetical protein
MTTRQEVEAILAGARAEHRALLEHVSPALRASLPVDATGITEAIDHLAAAAGLSPEEVHGAQVQGHRTNSAVLHGRVFGRAPLTRETVLAAFADGARVRAGALLELAREVGGEALTDEVRELVAEDLDVRPRDEVGAARATGPRGDLGVDPRDDLAAARLRALYASQERATVVIAEHLDAAA